MLGAGATKRFSAVRWGVAGSILVAWLLTIPCAGLVGAAMQAVTRIPGGAVVVFLIGVIVAVTAFTARSRASRRLEPSAATT